MLYVYRYQYLVLYVVSCCGADEGDMQKIRQGRQTDITIFKILLNECASPKESSMNGGVFHLGGNAKRI